MQLNILLISVGLIGLVITDPVPEEAVGTCSLQSGELLPDPPCYDNCKDTPDQRHFLTCIENSCFCRQAGPSHPEQQAAVPLNAGAVQEGAGQNVTESTSASSVSESSSGNVTTVAPSSASDVTGTSASSQDGASNATHVTSAGGNITENSATTVGVTGEATQVTPKS